MRSEICDGDGLDCDHDIDVGSAEPHLLELMSWWMSHLDTLLKYISWRRCEEEMS